MASETRATEQDKKICHGNLHSLNHGKVVFLASKKMQLLHWIFEQREQGLQVTSQAVQKVTEKIAPELVQKQ